jgi:hypothetical protein
VSPLFGNWSVGRGLAAASAAAVGYRIIRDAAAIRRRTIPATRIIIPAIAFIEIVLILAGRATRRSLAPATAAVELGLILWGLVMYRRLRPGNADLPEDRIAQALSALVPAIVARAVAVELVVTGLGLRSCLPPYRRTDPPGFPYRKDAYLRIVPILFVFTLPADMLLLGEILPSRLWLVHRVITGLDIYGFFWVLGFLETMRRRPHRVEEGTVELFRGIMNRARFERADVAEAAKLSDFDTGAQLKAYARKRDALAMAVAGVPLVEIGLRRPIVVECLFPPFRRTASRLIASANVPDDLVRALTPIS